MIMYKKGQVVLTPDGIGVYQCRKKY